MGLDKPIPEQYANWLVKMLELEILELLTLRSDLSCTSDRGLSCYAALGGVCISLCRQCLAL